MFSQAVRNFAPSWFASVMGTGVLALGSAAFGQRVPGLAALGWVLHYFNVALFFVLLLPWTLRWLRHRAEALATLRHPVHSQFYPTIAIALLVLGAQFLTFGGHVAAAAAFWSAGVVLTIFFSVAVPLVMFEGEQTALEHVTPGMFIPPVGLVVIPVAGSALAAHAQGPWRELVLFVCYTGLGAGFFLWIAVLALTFHRFVLGKPLPGTMAATVWINLGPIGVVVTSLVGLVGVSPFVNDPRPFYALAFLLWGFGAWWLTMAPLLTLRYWRRRELPFALSWWAFTFPLGAYAVSSHRLGTLLQMDSVWAVGFAAYLMLGFLWGVTLFRTLKGVADGSLIAAAPAPPSPEARPG